NHDAMITYGSQAQGKLLNFSHTMLEQVRRQDVGEIGEIIHQLMSKLNQMNPEELKPEKRGFFSRVFGKLSNSVQEILSKYEKTSAQIDRIAVQLERSKNILMSDIHYVKKLYVYSKEKFHGLIIYIPAAELILEDLYAKLIPELQQEGEGT